MRGHRPLTTPEYARNAFSGPRPSKMFLEENKLFPRIRRLENLETIIGIKNHYALYAL